MTKAEVVREIRRKVKEVGSAAALARAWGVSKVYISDVIKGDRLPGPSLLGPMGLESVMVYRLKRGTEEVSPSEK